MKNNVILRFFAVLILCSFSIMTIAKPKNEFVKGITSPIIFKVAAYASVLDGQTKNDIGVDLFNINCYSDTCYVTRLSLNHCEDGLNKNPNFRARVDEWASTGGSVHAKLTNKTLELTVFQASSHQLPAKILVTFDDSDKFFEKPKSIKLNGFIDFLRYPNVDIFIEYEIVKVDELKQLNCPVFLPGLN
jgi:hypothetical protein